MRFCLEVTVVLLVLLRYCKAFASHPTFITKMSPAILLKSASSNVSNVSTRSENMEERAKEGLPLDESELDDVIKSVRNIISSDSKIDLDALKTVLLETAHLSHKDWARTEKNAERLGKVLMPEGMSPESHKMFERIVTEGKWDEAAKHGTSLAESEQPWAVLVTGVNGIRKTTSIYQPWFPDLLSEALVAPKDMKGEFSTDQLPCGGNTFFRQLDHMIATLCNEDFSLLYSLTEAEMDGEESPSKEIIQQYSNLKAAIFTRYRTLSELLGALLLEEAQKTKSNCACETSGRDVAMFHYVDHFFPSGYNKLALHFTINDLSFAKESVDARMISELKAGIAAVDEKSVKKIIFANQGGPYGSEVLPGVQEASDRVWNEVVLKGHEVGEDWYKATIEITAHATEPWTARAVRPDGTLGTVFKFEKR